MLHVAEAVIRGHGGGQVVEPAVAHLLHPPAGVAGEVVVMPPAAEQKRLVAVLTPERVRHALAGQALEVAVDGGQAHSLDPAVELLRG